MPVSPLIERILEDEGITSDLEEAEAITLVKWLVGQAERAIATASNTAEQRVTELRKQGRNVARYVATWRDNGPEKALAFAKTAGLPISSTPFSTAGELLTWTLGQLEKK